MLIKSGLKSAEYAKSLPIPKPSKKGMSVIGYRSTSPQYAKTTEILTGVGSKKNGGRWNPPGIAVIYLSLSPETAMAEILAHYRYYNIPFHTAMPRVFVAVDAQLSIVLDLTSKKNIQSLKISGKNLASMDWRKEMGTGKEVLTQAIGLAAYSLDYEAVLVPSAADFTGKNLIIFPDKQIKSSKVTLLAPDKLMIP